MLKSKLTGNYPTDIGGLVGDISGLDPVFAGRLSHLAKSKGVALKITEGFRTRERQTELYKRYLRGLLKSAAKPGTSWHEFRLAVDTSTQPYRNMTNAQLKPYGLCKPISSEGWHIQPIETLWQTDRLKWAPSDLSSRVQSKFGLADVTMEYLEKYKYAEPLLEGLLNGKKDFAEGTMEYLKAYEYGADLIKKLGL